MRRERRYQVILGIEVMLAIMGTFLYGVPILVISCLFLSLFLLYGYLQMRSIRQLSQYMMRVRSGEYSLELRDYQEGELSILKSEVYKSTLMLTEQAELLQKDKTYLADAISDISHQLKTPLTSMGMMVDLLIDNTLTEDKRMEFLANLSNGVDRISWLVSSLLKMSKLDAGAVLLKEETVEIEKLLDAVLKQFLIPMELKNQTIKIVKIGAKNQATCKLDFSWTVEAISNIIKNCLEHSPVGGTIWIRYEQTSFYTVIVIQDQGEGIDKEDLPHIFERFYKGKNSSSDSVGIGLALSKQILTLQKGVITVESNQSSGTTFTIKLYR